MKKVFLLLILLVSCNAPPKSSHTYRLAIVSMFKNEAPWLKEWIVYHADVLGVEHFYLYNNDSTDNYKEVLEPYVASGLVELIDWSSSDENHRLEDPAFPGHWLGFQLGAFNDCLRNRALGVAKWLAVIDIDEFIVPTKGAKSFYKLLDDAERRNKGTVKLLWKVFGTSRVRNINQGELLTEKLMLRAPDEHDWHLQRKSIHRPEALISCHIHETHELREKFGSMTAKPDLFRIHHYWTRTEEFLQEKRTCKVDDPFFQTFNSVRDDTMKPYLPELKKALQN